MSFDLERLRRARRASLGREEEEPDDYQRLRSSYHQRRRARMGEDRDQSNRPFALRALSGAARGLAGALEPLQIVKDPFDAVVAGQLDPDTTITDRLSRLDWASYIPFGEAPPRAATGDEILGLMGVENERARQIGGFVFDVAADPLIAGAALRGAGAIARGSRVGSELTRVGERLDRSLSLAGAWRAADRVPGKRWAEGRVGQFMDTMLDTKLAWESGPAARTVRDLVQTPTSRLRGSLPKIDRRTPSLGEAGVTGRTVGEEVFIAQGRARQRGRAASEQAMDILEEARKGVLGEDAEPFFRKGLRILSQGNIRAQRSVKDLPPQVRDAIFRMGYDVSDQVGFAVTRSIRSDAAQELAGEFRGMLSMRPEQVRAMDKARDRVKKVAKESGYDPQEATRRFDQFVERITEADALLGYHLSGYQFVKRRFYESMAQRGIGHEDAYYAWREVQARGMAGENIEEITELNGRSIREFLGEGVEDLGEFLHGEQSFRGLNVGTYLRGLREGHMRRSYGLFQDRQTFETYLANLEVGRVLPNNIIDDVSLRSALGADSDEYRAVTRYLRNMESPARGAEGATPRGMIVGQRNLMEAVQDDLVRRAGVPTREAKRRAHRGIGNLIEQLNGGQRAGEAAAWESPIGRMVRQVRDATAKYEDLPGGQPRAGTGRAFFREREELSEDMLNLLGEVTNPLVSLRETARAARSQIPFSDALSDMHRLGRENGYVFDNEYFDAATRTAYAAMPKDPNLGALAGKYVHPALKKEVYRMMQKRGGERGAVFQRLRSLITGGYLASPNVIMANLAGGVYTSALSGIGPQRMLPAMGNTLRKFYKSSRDPNFTFQELEDLKRFIAIDDTTMVDANVQRGLKRMEETQEFDVGGARGWFDAAADWWQGQLDAPLGVKAAGLDGFQFVENWMKVSAFRAERLRLAREAGVNVEEFSKPFRLRSRNARAVDRDAAEAARLAVFDYSDAPDLIDMARKSGAALFPAFPYFLTARTARMAFERPGRVAIADRLSDSLNQAQMSDEDRLAVYASMPDWLREEQGVVVPFSEREDEAGDTRRAVIPFNGLVPTSTLAGNPWFESLSSAGIYKPFLEAGSAWFVNESGEAPFSATYGQRVFNRSSSTAGKLGETLGFLAQNLSPGIARKAGFTPASGFESGAIPAALEALAPRTDGPLAESMYTAWEIENRRADRNLFDEAVSATVRSPQVITTSGPLANVRKNVEASRQELNQRLGELRERARMAARRGNRRLAAELQERMVEERRAWLERVRPQLIAVEQAQD